MRERLEYFFSFNYFLMEENNINNVRKVLMQQNFISNWVTVSDLARILFEKWIVRYFRINSFETNFRINDKWQMLSFWSKQYRKNREKIQTFNSNSSRLTNMHLRPTSQIRLVLYCIHWFILPNIVTVSSFSSRLFKHNGYNATTGHFMVRWRIKITYYVNYNNNTYI